MGKQMEKDIHACARPVRLPSVAQGVKEHTLITIEGTDGSGKKTQIAELYKHLKSQGREVVVISFPQYDSPSSAPVKMYLGGELGDNAGCLNAYQASVLYAVDRICTMRKFLKQLTKPTIILFDRYVQSNMIHQAGKIKKRAELEKFLNWLDEFEFEILGLPRVDKAIFLDVPPDISFKASNEREQLKIGEEFTKDIHECDKKHITDAYKAAKYVAKKYNWSVINCMTKDGKRKTVTEIHELIREKIKQI